MTQETVELKCGVDGCKYTTDKYRYCINCNTRLCWEHVGRLSVAVHNNQGMRETAFYVCQKCLANEPLLIFDLLEIKKKTNPAIETIDKIISVLKRDRPYGWNCQEPGCGKTLCQTNCGCPVGVFCDQCGAKHREAVREQ